MTFWLGVGLGMVLAYASILSLFFLVCWVIDKDHAAKVEHNRRMFS